MNTVLRSFTMHQVDRSAVVDKIAGEHFSFKVTPHMVSALEQGMVAGVPGAFEAFCRAFVPSRLESSRIDDPNSGVDCIGEEWPEASPVSAITNFYRSRVLFRITTICPAYCRYCFRRRMVGDGIGAWDEHKIEEGLRYIRGNTEIKEVILSGGDPFTISDARLSTVLVALREIPHVRRIRIDTKALTMLPQRLTDSTVSLLRQSQPLYIIGHFTHPHELSIETRKACSMLIDAGVPVRSHTPLLKGINDDEATLASLMEQLVDLRIQPYYLIHFIPTRWSEHHRVPITRGLQLVQYLQRQCGGIATPTYIVYLPDAGGKVPVSPQYIRERTADGYLFENLEGRLILYPEPSGGPHDGQRNE